MEVLGNRVYLLMPELPESKIEVSPEIERERKAELAQKFEKLTVFAIGKAINEDDLEIGDEVFVNPVALRNASMFKIDEKEVICVPIFDIMHIW